MEQTRWLVFRHGAWRNSGVDSVEPATRFADIKHYYSNLIDYLRVVMCLLATVTLLVGQPLATAALLLGSTLLDWVDGPVARRHNQCTIFGSGVDWLADMLAQIVTLAWWVSLAPAMLPVLMVATAIELTNCIFDFATTATGRYPVPGPQTGFRIILEWSMPGGSYTPFGTILWLAYPLVSLLWCLDLSWPVQSAATSMMLRGGEVVLVVPALLYIWCEAAYTQFIIESWREAPRDAVGPIYDDGPAGMAHLGIVDAPHLAILQSALDSGRALLRESWEASAARREIFWINLWQRSGDARPIAVDGLAEIDRWARTLCDTAYAGQSVECDGYGFIINPMNSRTQPWHVDYTMDYSTIFVPLTPLSPENSLQYAVLPVDAPQAALSDAHANLDVISLQRLLEASPYISVRQLLAPPFSILKLDFGAIHRGISNTAGYERTLFWISFSRRADRLPLEPVVEVIRKESGNADRRSEPE